MNDSGHIPVLVEPIQRLLSLKAGQCMIDVTIGRAGHALALLPAISPGGCYVGLDTDPSNAQAAREALEPEGVARSVEVKVVHANFRHLSRILDEQGVGPADAILADLGFASNQMSNADRGLSFSQDGPLDMRLDPSTGMPASELINTLPERELADLIFQFGEERLSRKIARKIVEIRRTNPINTTAMLAQCVRDAYGGFARKQRIDPATRTFMALRIAVNDELGSLDTLLDEAMPLLKAGGKLAIISFHSLEDRRVKRRFMQWRQEGLGDILTRKPVIANDAEVASNPRSRSAKLRVFQRN